MNYQNKGSWDACTYDQVSYLVQYKWGQQAGCQSVESNTADSCELTIKGYEGYCPNRPDDPSCSDFLYDPSNKITPSPYGLCAQQPYHPGCPQITDPERYCLTTDDQAFCRTIGDICDAEGFVKAEDAYCTDIGISDITTSEKNFSSGGTLGSCSNPSTPSIFLNKFLNIYVPFNMI
jgi:hypothetical protein